MHSYELPMNVEKSQIRELFFTLPLKKATSKHQKKRVKIFIFFEFFFVFVCFSVNFACFRNLKKLTICFIYFLREVAFTVGVGRQPSAVT